ATADWERAHDLAQTHAPKIARDAARTMLERAPDPAAERRWIDAVLATRPPPAERATLLVSRADARRREPNPDLAAAIADLHEAIVLTEDTSEATETRRRAYQLEAEMLATSGDQRARARALTALARLADRPSERVEVETAAAAAWLAADEPAAALPHGARAHAELAPDLPSALRREVLTTLGEAAWRQRAWPDVIRAYKGLVDDPQAEAARIGTYRYRLAVAADRSGDQPLAALALKPLVDFLSVDAEGPGADAARATSPEIRGQALRLYADLAERAGDLAGAATALEGFAGVALESTASARADAMYRAGELFRRASLSDQAAEGRGPMTRGRPDDAVRCLEGALRLNDTHLPALDALELIWRERGDLERVSVILGRKVAVTGRHPQRQKPLLSRLGDLQDQLGRPDVALATHQRALEIDPTWRPSLRYVTARLRDDGAVVAAAGGFAQLAGELAGDSGVDLAIVVRERQLAAQALAQLVVTLDEAQVDAVRAASQPALERAALDAGPGAAEVAAALAHLRGEKLHRDGDSEENTPNGRMKDAPAGALSLRDAAKRARAAGKLDETFAALEAANHVSPGDPEVLAELVELALQLGDPKAAGMHLASLAELQTGPKKGDTLHQLADVYYDKLDDAPAARIAMRAAAEAFGPGTRRDATLRLLGSEAASHLAWDVAVEAASAIEPARRTSSDVVLLASALVRAGKVADAITVVEDATAAGKFEDGGLLLRSLRGEQSRKAKLASSLDERAETTRGNDADELREEAHELWHSIGSVPGAPSIAVLGMGTAPAVQPITLAAAEAREKLIAAHRDNPDDPAAFAALLEHYADREPAMRRALLDRVAQEGSGRVQAMAHHELALLARSERDPVRAAATWSKAHRIDPSYAPVWMPLADALAASDEIGLARDLYEQIAESTEYDEHGRRWAAERAEALAYDGSVVSGEIGTRPPPSLDLARELAASEAWAPAIAEAERVADEDPANREALELLELLYLETGDVTATSEAIGRQLMLAETPDQKAVLWRRRAKLYRDALGRDAEAYRCLKEAHACAPADPEIAYQLRTAAMVRGEWALVASLLYREIAAAPDPRERGALHLELALVFEERLDDPDQAQVNYEQALAFDPSIPAAKAPLARRYEAIGRHSDAARLYNEAANGARPADRVALYQAAARNRSAAAANTGFPALAASLDKAEQLGDREAALDLAHQLWRAEPGHAAAYRVLATEHRSTGDLAALTELTTLRASKAVASEERAAAWLEVARLAEELGKLTEAARAYDLALIEDPSHGGALDARGSLAFRLADWPTADLIYRDLAASDSALGPDDFALRRSIISENLGRHEEALELAKEAATNAPGRLDIVLRVQHLATAVGELRTAIIAARQVLELIPLTDDDLTLRTRHSLVELYRIIGDFDDAIVQLEHIVRDHPHHAPSIELIAEMYISKGDWATATRYLFQLVPLAPTAVERAERLYRLGEAVLVHLGDIDRADDVFLRASDLDPTHVPTLRRLLDVYWRADDPGSLVEVAAELARTGGLKAGPVAGTSLAQALVAAALVGETSLARQLVDALGDDAPPRIAAALGELVHRAGRFELTSATTAIAELGRRGVVDMVKLRAAAIGTPIEPALVAP
ncbi:MAG: hypothetical protein HOV81_09040, partial [Kofleriaceae bacterium]|nr:hypothetical protein [Kofleriaceae bacterium]